MSLPSMPSVDIPPLTVVCLCAGWCHICEEYQQTFAALAEEFAGKARLIWVDIEEQEEIVGALDIENFPTMLIGNADKIRFFGAITQIPGTARQLIRKGMMDELGEVSQPELRGMLDQILTLDSPGS